MLFSGSPLGKNNRRVRAIQNLKQIVDTRLAGISMSQFDELRQRFGSKGLKRILLSNIRNAGKMLKDDHWLPITKDQERWYKQLGKQKKVRPTIIRRDYRQLPRKTGIS